MQPMDEEVVLLEEQVAALQADVESLQSRLADAETLAAGRSEELTQARQHLAEREASAAAFAQEAEALRGAAAAADERGRLAAGRYRELLLAREPDLPEDMVAGTTVEEIDAAADRARQTVSLVRQRFEAQAQATRVPAGAPARGARDTSGLSASEKIRLGLRSG
jgi:hypothetical protein